MNISENIKQIRESKRLSQAEVSRRLNLDPPSYFRFEKRGSKLSLEQIENIANALEVTVREVLGFGVETTDKSEIEILENENKILREKSEMLDNIESTFLSIFQNHYRQIEQDINDGEYGGTRIYDRKVTDDEKFNVIAFIVFCQETEWYEVSIKLEIIKEQKIRYAWSRYEYINPFSLKIDDIPKFKASNPDKSNLSDDEIIIEIVRERGKNKRYTYFDSEVETMLEFYSKISSGKTIVKSKNLLIPQSYIGESTKVKIDKTNDIIESSEKKWQQLPYNPRKTAEDNNPKKTMKDRLEELERKMERLELQKII